MEPEGSRSQFGASPSLFPPIHINSFPLSHLSFLSFTAPRTQPQARGQPQLLALKPERIEAQLANLARLLGLPRREAARAVGGGPGCGRLLATRADKVAARCVSRHERVCVCVCVCVCGRSV